MDCCDTNEKSEPLDDTKKMKENKKFSIIHETHMKGGKSIKMEKRIWLWVFIGALFIVVLFLVFKAGAGNVVQTAGGAAKSTATSAASSYSGMVGVC